MDSNTVVYPSLFEDDFIARSLGPIVNQPDVALTELVANAWDAGASHVTIFIPDSLNNVMVIEDDGTGMTEEEFQNRWMKIRYNRLKSQGKNVVFPCGGKGNRIAFGRNGVGRHGLLCFADEYTVITSKNGKTITFKVKSNYNHNPIAVVSKTETLSQAVGTRLEVTIQKNLPEPEKIRQIISARFLHDPQFEIFVNHSKLDLDDLAGGVEPSSIDIEGLDIHLTAYFIDTTKSSKKSVFQGIAFWQSNRLIGDPSWILGGNMVLDGRTALAKRYTFIIKTDDMGEYVKEDWSGFKNCEEVNKVLDAVSQYVEECFRNVTTATIESVTDNLEPDIKQALKDVNPLVRLEVAEAIKDIVVSTPKVKQESVNIAVKTLINVERAKNGKSLLEKLSKMSPDDINGLDELLSKWTVGDALEVLNEIDRRLAVISAIRKLASDDTTDELHVLHPLIAESRWLFGPEYESSEYIFNRQMKTAVSQIFGGNKFYRPETNYKRRPDLVCLDNSTIGVTGIEDVSDKSGIVRVRHLLLIELKKGAFEITRKERDQAVGYVEDLTNSTSLGGNCKVTGFVVGDKVSSNISDSTSIDGGNGVLYVTTYSQLVDTAEKRMFGLRSVLAERYDDIPGMELYRQIQISM